jgi:hypothetical protein
MPRAVLAQAELLCAEWAEKFDQLSPEQGEFWKLFYGLPITFFLAARRLVE